MGVEENWRTSEGGGFALGVEIDSGIRTDGVRNLRSIVTAIVVLGRCRRSPGSLKLENLEMFGGSCDRRLQWSLSGDGRLFSSRILWRVGII